jgi:hypothetical protein
MLLIREYHIIDIVRTTGAKARDLAWLDVQELPGELRRIGFAGKVV